MTAAERLRFALVELVERGQRPPCSKRTGDNLWLSERPEDRAEAVLACQPCPLIRDCGRAGDETRATFGVYGGTDRTKPTRKART